MQRLTIIFILFLILTLSSYKAASASVLVIKESGEIVFNVLSEDTSIEIPRHSFLEIKDVANAKPDKDSKVSLEKNEEGKISLIVLSDNQKREMDVSQIKDGLIEIEERAATQKLQVGIEGDKFLLSQNRIKAITDFPITIDSKSAEIIVKTPSGSKYVSILPSVAADTILRTKVINTINGNRVSIIEEERELQYEISGEKTINLFNLYFYTIPVQTRLSASTGEILDIEAPIWYKVLGFLFT
ncbi:hypothetical protein A2955_00240 [Candidatus Woesebacteria bacterium RIFCSPLOWO2_01_FULL_37_19]|uniref:Uncharacterized protein n=2 Tax=Candidatus Woeseibacteriota TaxID=1752722 RepID=A0A1F8BBW3_9BACT|nr:MAG: hypothetical protein A2771_01130 [Candidatus Woesebacteria bacterium RIFCSPHIGHO2_01_FULL_38_26b]OGM61159.1 MAG: hypothetical protein A2955_00240 [Candidatus Woesebacteria bacterium RIFCSPLOWO2_01_FULL_37_19]